MSAHPLAATVGFGDVTPEPKPELGTRNVVGVFDQLADAERVTHELVVAGLPADAIAIAIRGEGASPHLGTRETHAGAGLAVGTATGAIAGGAIALVLLMIPGFGPVLAAGQIAALATAAVAGGTLGALAGSFAGLGVSTEHAKRYEEAVRSGAVVVTVRATDESAAQETSETLTQAGAREVGIYQPTL